MPKSLTDKKVNLDETRLRSLDPGNMLGMTLELPEQLAKGAELGAQFLSQHPAQPFERLDWVGLGGSAVAGDLLQAFGFEPPLAKPEIAVHRTPGRARQRRLLCSYSGNTVETLHAFDNARPEEIWFCMTSGGELAARATAKNIPLLTLPGGYPPRAAVGYSLGALIAILKSFNDLAHNRDFELPLADLKADAARYRSLSPDENPALAEAVKLVNRTPVIYTTHGATMAAQALRFRAQLSENAKVWSHAAELPELAHNEVEAIEFLTQLDPSPRVIFLGTWPWQGVLGDPRPGIESLLAGTQATHIRFDPSERFPGQSRLQAGLRLMLFLDTASIYLALLRAINPLEIPRITRLKKETTEAC